MVLTGAEIDARYYTDISGVPVPPPIAVMRPRTTEDVSKFLRLCHLAKVPVTTQGGMTGLVGATVPQSGEIVLSMERMNAIEEEAHKLVGRPFNMNSPQQLGVIFYDETLRQKTRDGVPFAKHLASLGVVAGIKVDAGAKPLAGFANETITEGLDGLRERLIEASGARQDNAEVVARVGVLRPELHCLEELLAGFVAVAASVVMKYTTGPGMTANPLFLLGALRWTVVLSLIAFVGGGIGGIVPAPAVVVVRSAAAGAV